MKKFRTLSVWLLAILLLFNACGIVLLPGTPQTDSNGTHASVDTRNRGAAVPIKPENNSANAPVDSKSHDTDDSVDFAEHDPDTQAPPGEFDGRLPVYGASYYDLTNVVLYLEAYGELPPNYITKNEARSLGWEGGSVEKYKEGAAIGGDFFGNYEGLLPDDAGQRYTECDIDTNGYSSRGSRRLVFSDDGRYFYTSNHYESFSEYQVTAEYEVIPCE